MVEGAGQQDGDVGLPTERFLMGPGSVSDGVSSKQRAPIHLFLCIFTDD